MMNFLRKITPRFVLAWYHKTLSILAMLAYGNPSNKLIVIGVTGTNGKSSTVNYIAQLLHAQGKKVGAASTVSFFVNGHEVINDKKMTMLGRFALQKFLRSLVNVGCEYAVIETSSQGIEQYRHLGINYDYVIFTNLTPEHIEAHGGFDNYKKAKGKLFAHLTRKPRKTIKGAKIQKVIIANIDDENAGYYLNFPADAHIGFTLQNKVLPQADRIYTVTNPVAARDGVSFTFEGTQFNSPILGAFNIYNLVASLAVAFEEKLSLIELVESAQKLHGVPGRMELINEGQDFTVVVDYAPEPYSLEAAYAALRVFTKNRIIHVLGSCGGGRDVARRPILGGMAANYADIVIVTNEDPYDDDPVEIMLQVSEGAKAKGKVENENLFIVHDRKEAIVKAISLAQTGDIVLITGKGCEVFIASKGGSKIMHDDREVARNAIKKL